MSNQLPTFQGSLRRRRNQTHGASSGTGAGLSTLSLRNLGGARTLILIDGQRTVAASATGLVDINTIPQDLVTRVDVVTGGASAAYGSDALAGVVNFVLDKTYEGTKGEISGGITSYGDDVNYRIRLTEGFGFDGDRGHVIISGEDTANGGVKGVPRSWNNQGAALINNPAYTPTNGLPQNLNVTHAFTYTATGGGVIDSTAPGRHDVRPGGNPAHDHAWRPRLQSLQRGRRLAGLSGERHRESGSLAGQQPHLHACQLCHHARHQRLWSVFLGRFPHIRRQ